MEDVLGKYIDFGGRMSGFSIHYLESDLHHTLTFLVIQCWPGNVF